MFSLFQLLQWVALNYIEVTIKNFFLGQRGDKRKIRWKKWETLCLPKNEGGLNFEDLRKINEAMLAKKIWRLIHDKESLFYKVFKENFFPNCDIFFAQLKSGSYAWWSILSARKVILAGAKWRIGNGLNTRIYQDCWLPGYGSRKVIVRTYVNYVKNICHLELAYPLIKRTLLVIG